MKRQGEDHGDDVFMTEDDARKYYEHVQNASPRRYVELLKEVKQLDVKGQYLDVGSGPGFVTGMIARQQPEASITGMDISAEMVKIANEVIEDNLRERINFVVGDACDENTLTGLDKYDLIFSTFTMPIALKFLDE